MRDIKKRILFILHLPPPVHGAAMVGKYIKDSKLIKSSFDCRYINLAIASNLEDIGRMGVNKILGTLKLLVNIKRTVKDFRPDLVYVTPNAKGGAFYKDFTVVQLLKTLGCNVIVHYHNKGVSTMQTKWHYNLMYHFFFNNIKVILLSELLFDDVKKYVQHKDVFICPNGIPVTDVEYKERNNLVPHLLFLSNLIESKGVFVLFDALKILSDKGCPFVCDFVGGETAEIDRKRFAEEIEERELNKLVFYHGKKYGNDKDDMFQNADIFVFPSYYPNECFPLVLLEAMQFGLPIVTTKEGAIADIVTDSVNGLICKKNNAQSLADCIFKLIQEKSRLYVIGKRNMKKVKELYTVEAFEINMCNILKTVI